MAIPSSKRSVGWLVAAVGPLLFAGASSLSVPPDLSLSTSEYEALGVPDPTNPWSVREHEAALEVLMRLERRRLPRYGSPRSKPVFDALVASHEEYLESIWMSSRLGEDTFAQAREAPAAPRLYALDHDDRFLFDRELLELHLATLRQLVAQIESLAGSTSSPETLRGEVEAAERNERTTGLAESRRQSSEDLGRVTILALLPLVHLLQLEPTTTDTRRALRDSLAELLPAISSQLGLEKRDAIADATREAARLPGNFEIREDLLDLADTIGTASPEHRGLSTPNS